MVCQENQSCELCLFRASTTPSSVCLVRVSTGYFQLHPESDGDGAFYECRWGLTIEVIVSWRSEAALFWHPLLSEQGVKLRLKRRHLQPQTPPWHKHTWQTRESPQALLEQRKTHAHGDMFMFRRSYDGGITRAALGRMTGIVFNIY